MTAPTKLAVFFLLISLVSTDCQAQSVKNSTSINLRVEVREALNIDTENSTLKIQTNSPNAFFVLVYDEITHKSAYLPATAGLLLEEHKSYTVIPAP